MFVSLCLLTNVSFKMLRIVNISILTLVISTNFSCKEKEEVITSKTLSIDLLHFVNDLPVINDSIMYQNRAGNQYSVTSLNYYLSDFTFEDLNGIKHSYDITQYFDPFNHQNKLEIPNFKLGQYQKLTFTLGVSRAKNRKDGLPNNLDNIRMQWPEMMGGGYHFIKLEGHFRNQTETKGYAIHVGNSNFLTTCVIQEPFAIDLNNSLQLKMDINSFFESPYTYDLNKDPFYTMGDSASMSLIVKNAEDVFSIKK